MKASKILILILALLLPLISQTNLEAKYSFLLKEYKSLKKVNQILRQEKENDKKIYDLGLKRSAISNQVIRIQVKDKYQKRQQIGSTVYNIIVISAFISGFFTGIKINK